MSTHYQLPADANPKWYLIDMSGKRLGRVASQIAVLLMGKHLPTYTPFWSNGDKVVVINAAHLDVTGRKREKKLYYRHSGYPGGIKVATLSEKLSRYPSTVVRGAVKGMLPKNRLARQMLKNLYIYDETDHPHIAQNPRELTGMLNNQMDLFSALAQVQ